MSGTGGGDHPGLAGGAPDLEVSLGPIKLAHPIINASGTYDVLEEVLRYGAAALAEFPFAAYVPKTVTLLPREGNPPPRVTETASGMINAIGLANKGLEHFLTRLPELAAVPAPVIINVGGDDADDYAAVVAGVERRLCGPEPLPEVAGYELNVSCPNVRAGGLAIGADPAQTAALTALVRRRTGRFLIVKLTPNVTDIVAVARAAVEAGADGLSLVNTFKGMVLDRDTLKPFLGNRTGGVCGPAIKPLALRMVAEVAATLAVPIVGMGGVVSGQDALEFIACGAHVVAVGAANFLGREVPGRIVTELGDELAQRGFATVAAARGVALDSGT